DPPGVCHSLEQESGNQLRVTRVGELIMVRERRPRRKLLRSAVAANTYRGGDFACIAKRRTVAACRPVLDGRRHRFHATASASPPRALVPSSRGGQFRSGNIRFSCYFLMHQGEQP